MAPLTDLPSTASTGNVASAPGSDSAFGQSAPTEEHAANDGSRDAAHPEWARQALVGTAARLRQLLDDDPDPNAQTSGGTTLLMMAAADPEKVALLLNTRRDARAHRSPALTPSPSPLHTWALRRRSTRRSVRCCSPAPIPGSKTTIIGRRLSRRVTFTISNTRLRCVEHGLPSEWWSPVIGR
jgi:hypothetical protein